MNKYRLITNGVKFQIQRQGFLGRWLTIGQSVYGESCEWDFDTQEEAWKQISKWEEKDRPWTPVA